MMLKGNLTGKPSRHLGGFFLGPFLSYQVGMVVIQPAPWTHLGGSRKQTCQKHNLVEILFVFVCYFGLHMP